MTERKAQGDTLLGMDRRTFCVGAVGALALVGVAGGVSLVEPRSLVRPPGGQDEDRLNALCVRCEKCLTVCPHSIIAPAHVEEGLVTMRTPRLTFEENYCDWCEQANGGHPLCAQVCPTGALALPADAHADDTVIGIAEVNTEQCLAWRMMLCEFCSDACPYDAIELDDFTRPVVVEDRCTGCGACESVCVSLQNGSIAEGATERAIVVRSLGERE